MLQKRHIRFFGLLLLTSCVQPFEFEGDRYEQLLVVDGLLTDQIVRHTVTLGFTRPVDGDTILPVTGAEVMVLTDGVVILDYFEESPGFYRSNTAFQGITGQPYQLRIETSDDKIYESRPSTLLTVPPVDDLTFRYAELPSEELERNEPGIQFFLEADPGANGAGEFYRFDWSETAQVRVPFPSNWAFDTPCTPDECSWFLRDTRVSVCYETEISNGLTLGTTSFSVSNRLNEVPLRFVSLETDKLRNRYSLEASMYAIDEEAYQYYSRLKEVNESGGSLFDNQQGAVIGNLVSVSDPDEPVLGYFEVSGVSRRREFFDPSDYGPLYSVPPFRFACRGGLVVITTTPDSIGYYLSLRPGYQIINISNVPPEATLGPRSCTDCSWYAPTAKPEFWED